MKDKLPVNELKLTIPELQERLKSHYGMYVHVMTKKSSKNLFDYQQWLPTTIVNGDFIKGLINIKGLIKISVWFENPLLNCDII